MDRVKRNIGLGLRWIRCGWRLFLRNPWQLGGMGFCGATVAVALTQIPLIGVPLLGFLAPAAVAAFYVAIEEISKQKIKLPRALRFSAIKQSPREFLSVTRDERRLMQVLALGLYSMIAFVLVDILAWLIAGPSLFSPLANLTIMALIIVAIATLLRIAIYLALGASLIFTLPLVVIRNEGLVPAMAESVRRTWDHSVSLLVVAGLWAVPFILGALTAFYITWIGYLFALLSATFLLPISVCSFYCSYRTVMAASQSTHSMDGDVKRANYV